MAMIVTSDCKWDSILDACLIFVFCMQAATFNVRLSQLDESASHLRAELAANGEVLRALKEVSGLASDCYQMRCELSVMCV